jgi:hypothetical protein
MELTPVKIFAISVATSLFTFLVSSLHWLAFPLLMFLIFLISLVIRLLFWPLLAVAYILNAGYFQRGITYDVIYPSLILLVCLMLVILLGVKNRMRAIASVALLWGLGVAQLAIFHFMYWYMFQPLAGSYRYSSGIVLSALVADGITSLFMVLIVKKWKGRFTQALIPAYLGICVTHVLFIALMLIGFQATCIFGTCIAFD